MSHALMRLPTVYLPTAFFVVTLVFLLPRLMPGDPLLARLDPESSLYITDADARAHFKAYYDLDGSLPEQYAHYLTSLARGDLGWSITRNARVSELIAAHLPWTLLLLVTAIGVSSVLAFFAGVAAAWRRGRVSDRALLLGTTGMRALPEYVLAVGLLVLFAVVFPVFPLSGTRTPFAEYGSRGAEVVDIAHHLVLPATALALGMLAAKFLLVRNTTISALGQDYMLLAQAKGLPEHLLKYRHAGRNSLLPLLTVVGVQVGFVVGGAIFVETVFSYPGMGTLILRAVGERDYPVLEACFLTLAATVLLANFLVDLAYGRLDPRAGAQ